MAITPVLSGSGESARISKALDLRKSLLELPNNIASVCRGDA